MRPIPRAPSASRSALTARSRSAWASSASAWSSVTLEPFVRPTLRLDLLAPGFQSEQCRGWISLGQMDAGSADWEFVHRRQIRRGRNISLPEQDHHLRRGDVSQPMHKFVLVHEVFGLTQTRGGRSRAQVSVDEAAWTAGRERNSSMTIAEAFALAWPDVKPAVPRSSKGSVLSAREMEVAASIAQGSPIARSRTGL